MEPQAGHRGHRRRLPGAELQPPARHHPPRRQARQHHDQQGRRGEGDGLRHRPRAGRQRQQRHPDRRRDRHRAVPVPRAGPRREPSTPAPTCTRWAAFSTKSSPVNHLSSATRPWRWPTSTSARTRSRRRSGTPASPPSLDAVVLKALAKNPENRYQTAAEMRTDLIRVHSGEAPEAPKVFTDAERTSHPDQHRPVAAARCPPSTSAPAAGYAQPSARRLDRALADRRSPCWPC